MNRLCMASAAYVLIVCSAVLAHAAPPTVTPSPGYDARLQEQRKAATSTSVAVDPATPVAPRAPRHHAKARK